MALLGKPAHPFYKCIRRVKWERAFGRIYEKIDECECRGRRAGLVMGWPVREDIYLEHVSKSKMSTGDHFARGGQMGEGDGAYLRHFIAYPQLFAKWELVEPFFHQRLNQANLNFGVIWSFFRIRLRPLQHIVNIAS